MNLFTTIFFHLKNREALIKQGEIFSSHIKPEKVKNLKIPECQRGGLSHTIGGNWRNGLGQQFGNMH